MAAGGVHAVDTALPNAPVVTLPPADDELVITNGVPKRPLWLGENILLDMLLSNGWPCAANQKTSAPRSAAAAATPLTQPAAVTSGWAVPPEVASSPGARYCFRPLTFSEEDVSALLVAGWVWQDILAEDDGIVRTLQRVPVRRLQPCPDSPAQP